MSAGGLYGALVPLCVAAGLAGLAAWARPARAAARRGADVLGFTSLACALVAWTWRWSEAGHMPIFGSYESALSLALATLAGPALVRTARLRRLAWPACGFLAAALLVQGLGFDDAVSALTISERSLVVEAHALLAWAAFGCLALNAAAAVVFRLHPSDELAGLLTTTLSLGFFLHSGMLASGSLYRFMLFGEAWGFDPIEILGLLVWVSYGALLHLHLMAGWERRRLASWCLALFALLVFSYRGIVTYPSWSTYHILDVNLRLHVAPGAEAAGDRP